MGNERSRWGHPTQKPDASSNACSIDIANRVTGCWIVHGSDTAAVCFRMGRNCVGVERGPFFAKARTRIC